QVLLTAEEKAALSKPLTDGEKADEERAVAAIERAGGHVTRDPTRPDSPVAIVHVNGPMFAEFTDAGLAPLRALPRLCRVLVSRPQDTGDGFKHLQGSPWLRELYIYCDPSFTGAGLKYLQGAPALESLYLLGNVNDATPYTGTGLEYLPAVPKLHSLSL